MIAGDTLLRPSANNHYVHLAGAWLDGRLAHEGTPPGYPRAHDDWGRVTTLRLRDGEEFRGTPCRTRACDDERRASGRETWRGLGGETRTFARREIAGRSDTWYVTFPPAPALLMLPGVALAGLAFPDVLFTALLAALIPAILAGFLDRVRGTGEGRGREHLWIAAAWALASPALFVGAHGSVWFTAQICGALFLLLFVTQAWELRRPGLAGLCLGLAVASRPHMAVGGLFFVFEWLRCGRPWRGALRFAGPLAAIGAALMLVNWARFADPFEFGHRALDIRWQRRIQEIGMFSPAYLRRNLECMLWLGPQLGAAPPFARWSIHGMGLLVGSPWLLALAAGRERFAQRRGLWIAAIALMIPPLLYHNSGQVQVAYRFALDYLALLLVILACGGGARRRWFPALVIVSALVHLYGAWMFHRAPGELFVRDLWWPFAPEG